MKKKIVSVLLVLCLMLSLSVSAFAADLTPATDKTSIAAGEDVTVTLTLNEKIENIVTIQYKLYFNKDLFDYKSSTSGAVPVTVGNVMTDKDGTYMNVSTMDTTSEGQTLEGMFCTLTFTAKKDVPGKRGTEFRLVFDNCMNTSFKEETHTAGAAASVTVTPVGTELTLYGQILGSSINEKFADITGTGNGEEYTCLNTDKKTGLDVIKGVLDAKGYSYVATATAITSVTDKNGVTLKNGDEAYGPKSGWTFTINGEKPGTYGITTLNEYVVDDEAMGFDGDEFRLIYAECATDSGKHTFGDDGVCTVCGKSNAVAAEYTLTMGEDKTVKAGENVQIPVTVGYTTDAVTSFNAVDMQFAYDTAKLEFVSVSDTKNYTVSAENGVVRVQGYGENKALGEAFTLTFKALAATDENGTLVTAQSAKVDEAMNAIAKDAPEAKLLDAETVLTIKATHSVTLPNIFEGETTVEDGANYTFSKTDKDESHYEYTNVKAMVDGKDVEVVDNGDGTYTVKNVTGDLTVTGKRTAKQYPITVDGNAKGRIRVADTVPYGEDYVFTAENLETDKYDYTLTMTINGKSYTPEFDDSAVSFMNTYFYTIKGDAITGDIHITFTQTEKGGAETTTVNFTGSGAADVTGGNPQTATTGADFTFTVNEDAKYNYTVKLGDEVLTGTNGSYTIPGAKVVSGTITVTVEKTVSTQGVKVQKYVKLENQQSVWLVTVEADPGANNVYTYGGERMFKTTKYGTNGTYAYLVIAPTLSVEDAAAKLGITAGEAAGTVSYGGDVNGSNVVDINDAQLVYDLYNAHYSDFTTASMYKFLCADIADDTPEGSTLLNVSDAVAVISKINQQ